MASSSNFKYSYAGNDNYLTYFSDNNTVEWSFDKFSQHVNSKLANPILKDDLLSIYIHCLRNILNSRKTPKAFKNVVNGLINEAINEKESKSSANHNYFGPYIYGINSNIIAANTYNENNTSDIIPLKRKNEETEKTEETEDVDTILDGQLITSASDSPFLPSSQEDLSSEIIIDNFKTHWTFDIFEVSSYTTDVIPTDITNLILQQEASSNSTNNKNELYLTIIRLIHDGLLSPSNFDSQLLASGLFTKGIDTDLFPRGDLPPTIIKNISLLRHAIEDRKIYSPESFNITNMNEFYLNHIINSVFIVQQKQYISSPSPSTFTGEMDFIHLYITSLFTIFNDSITISWDTTSSLYKNNSERSLDQKKTRSNIIINAKLEDGTTIEIGNGEIKPPQKSKSVYDEDRVKMLKMCKRQLHQRLLFAVSENELKTFGVMIHGDIIELYIVCFDHDKFYTYYPYATFKTPFFYENYLSLESALEYIVGWKEIMKKSLSCSTNNDKKLFDKYKHRLLPTLAYYLLFTTAEYQSLLDNENV
ncbi:unnamed protein product [Cunninghamella blakesleeana]